jgi:hypothetical protein
MDLPILPSTDVFAILAQRAAADELANDERRRAPGYDPIAERAARRKMRMTIERRVMRRLEGMKTPTADDARRVIREEMRRR